jgi:hypothetical protein
VVKALRERGECALVDLATGDDVVVYADSHNEHAPWRIEYHHYDILDKPVLKEALGLDLELGAIVNSRHTYYVLHRNCFGIRAAAIKALRLARLMAGVPEDAWLWITLCEPDQRETPPPGPPVPWPPADA